MEICPLKIILSLGLYTENAKSEKCTSSTRGSKLCRSPRGIKMVTSIAAERLARQGSLKEKLNVAVAMLLLFFF